MNLYHILVDERLYENILDHNISFKTSSEAKPLRISFDKLNGFIRLYDGNRYLVLLGSEKYDSIYNRSRYLKGIKSGMTYITSHNYAKIKVDSYDSFPREKTMTFHNDIMFIKSVFNRDKNNY